MRETPRWRALVVRAGALGDLLMLRGAIASLKRAGYSVSLLAPARHAQALAGDGDGDVDQVLDWEGAETASLLARNEAPADGLGACLSSCDCALVYSRQASLISVIEKRVPRVLARDPSPPPGRRAFDWYAEVVRCLGLSPVVPKSCLANRRERALIRAFTRRLPAGFLAMHPGSGSERKNWPVERFARLAASAGNGRPWLLVEGPAEHGRFSALSAESNVIIANELPLRVLGALLGESGVYVGNDSGVTHLAAAWGATTVALFGPTDSAMFAPVGENVTVVNAPENDMRRLDPSVVITATIHARRSKKPRTGQVSDARTSTRLISR
ncbi:MAG: glycosyltransferase family 9 protein [Vicinamibacteria bacterium]|nr:glycosyltransferase family 9 protein [Vicinamibacteria bacterium]